MVDRVLPTGVKLLPCRRIEAGIIAVGNAGKFFDLIERLPPAERKPGEPRCANSGKLLVSRAHNRASEDVRLELHEGSVSSCTAVRAELDESHAAGCFHRGKDVGDLEGDGLNSCACHMGPRVMPTESADRAACIRV